MRTVIYILSFMFLISGCTGQRKTSSKSDNNEVSNIIDLTAGFNNIQTVKLSEIADSVTFIPFETTPQSLMGLGQRNIRFTTKFIFFIEKYFNWDGNYLGSIIKKGPGPFEEVDGGKLLYKDNHFYSKGSKFIEYDLNGKPTGKVKYLYNSREFESNDFLRMGVEFFTVGDNFAIYNYPTTMYYFNKDFETVSSRVVFQADSLPPRTSRIGYSKYITDYKDKILFYNFINDTIFYVTDNGLEPRWIVSFDHPLRLSTNVILDSYNLLANLEIVMRSGSIENSELIQLTDNKHEVMSVYETESHLFFLMTEIIQFAEPRGKTPPEPYIIYYDKNTGKSTRVKGNGFSDDLLGMDFFYPQLGIFEGKMITYIWPYELFDYIEKYKEKGREVNLQLIALSKKLKPDDNPVLIVAHLKKEV